jgi:tRNA-dihydrouridine synthase B
MKNPWIFRQIRHFLETRTLLEEPAIEQRLLALLEHLELCLRFKGTRGLKIFRKFYSCYLRGIPHTAELRRKLVTLEDPGIIREALCARFKCDLPEVPESN